MVKKLLVLMAIVGSAAYAGAQGCSAGVATAGVSGGYLQIMPNPIVRVYLVDGVTPATIYSNAALTTPLAQPFNGNSYGAYTFCAVAGQYVVSLTGYNKTTTVPVVIGSTATKPYVDVRDYGAKCDGVTDDSAAYALARAVLVARGGGVLKVYGNCATTAILDLHETASIIVEGGSSNATGYNAPPADNIVYIGSSAAARVVDARSTNGFGFRNVGLLLKTVGFTGVGIDLSHSIASDATNWTIENCWISGNDQNKTAGQTDQASALILTDDAILGKISNCHLHWAQRGIRGIATAGHYANGINVNTVLLDNLRVAGITDAQQGWTLSGVFCEGTDGTSAPPTHGMPYCYKDVLNASGPTGMTWTGGWIGDAVNMTDATFLFTGCHGCTLNPAYWENGYGTVIKTSSNFIGTKIQGGHLSGATASIDLGSIPHYGLEITGIDFSSATVPIAGFTCPTTASPGFLQISIHDNFAGSGLTPPACIYDGISGSLVTWLNATVKASKFTSSVATGTAPLTVASTTQVSNLNASFLQGLSFTQLTDTPGAITVNANTCTDRAVAFATAKTSATITLAANYALEANLGVSVGQAVLNTAVHYRICNYTAVNITLAAGATFNVTVIQ